MDKLGDVAKAVLIVLGILVGIGLILLLSPLVIAFGYLLVSLFEFLLPVLIAVAIIAGVYYYLQNRESY